MTRVTLSVSGKLKEPYWEAACREYEKRLSAYCSLEIKQTPDGTPPVLIPGAFTIALCPEGDMPSSEGFAGLLQKWQNTGKSRLCFLIGGSDGLPETLKSEAGYRLSLSRMTWPHHMARALLEEQLYRAFNILAGGKYHK